MSDNFGPKGNVSFSVYTYIKEKFEANPWPCSNVKEVDKVTKFKTTKTNNTRCLLESLIVIEECITNNHEHNQEID